MRQEEEEEQPIPLFLRKGLAERAGRRSVRPRVSTPHPGLQSGGDVFGKLRKTLCPLPGACKDHLGHSLRHRGVVCGHITGSAAWQGQLCGS